MGISIVLRKQLNVNWFRDLMIDVVGAGYGNNALLCSGFFQENFKASAYQASQERNFASVLAANNIDLITVGIHNSTWKNSYRNFKNNLVAAGVSINSKYKNGLRWHAKVFILSQDEDPIFGIVGSSNITRTAFSTLNNFNYECDVILWPDSEKPLDAFLDELFTRPDIPHEIIRAPYIEELNNGLTIQDRLKSLKQEILEVGLIDLD